MIEWLSTNNNWLSALAALVAIALAVIGLIRWLTKRPDPLPPPQTTRFPSKDDDHKETVRSKNETIEAKNDLIAFLQAQILDREEQVKRIRAEDDAKHVAQIKGLEDEITELRARLADPDRARAEFEDARKEATEALELEANTLGADRVKAAEDAMANGDFAAAKALFQEIKNEEELAEQRSARASYALGEIAEAEVRWSDAADHFARTAELNDDFEHLYKAREYAWRAGRLPQALVLGEKMLAATDGERTEQRARALNEHALTLKATGRYEEAEPLYREALEITRESLGERHPTYAIRLNNLAGLLQATGRFEEAEPLLREALEIDREALGERHPAYAIDLNNLAGLLRATGRFEEAEPLLREALEIGRETLGERHPDYAVRLNNLAGLLQATGRFEEAEQLYREALEIRRGALGDGIRIMHKASTTLRACFGPRAGPRRPNRSTARRWRSTVKRWGSGTRTMPPTSTTSRVCLRRRAGLKRPNRTTARRWRLAGRRWGSGIRTMPSASTTSRACSGRRAGLRRPNRSTARRWRSSRPRLAPTTPTRKPSARTLTAFSRTAIEPAQPLTRR